MKKLLLVLFLTLFPILAHGATYYTAKTGSDSNSCSNAQSQSTPKLTINAGINCLNAGDTLIVKSGTYNESIAETIPSGLSAGYALHGYSSGGVSNNIIRHNYFHDTGAPVLMCHENNQLHNNILVLAPLAPAGQRNGIETGQSCSGAASGGNRIYNNTIVDSGGSCITSGYSSGNIVRNNICYQNDNDAVVGGSGTVVSNNLLGQNPLFVNAAAGDFHLQNGRPAIDAGVVITGLSFHGSAPDLGALESGAGGQLPAPRNLRLTGN